MSAMKASPTRVESTACQELKSRLRMMLLLQTERLAEEFRDG
jgi:hypothetical protein